MFLRFGGFIHSFHGSTGTESQIIPQLLLPHYINSFLPNHSIIRYYIIAAFKSWIDID